jgi:hypothetical protein
VDKINIPNKTGPAWARMPCLDLRGVDSQKKPEGMVGRVVPIDS